MTENESKSRWSAIVWIVPLFLVLYVLSVGPVIWIVENLVPPQHKSIVTGTFNYVYAPLTWIIRESEAVYEVAVWYLGLWR